MVRHRNKFILVTHTGTRTPGSHRQGSGPWGLGAWGSGAERERSWSVTQMQRRVWSLSAICRPQSHLHPQGLFGIPPTTHDRAGLGIST